MLSLTFLTACSRKIQDVPLTENNQNINLLRKLVYPGGKNINTIKTACSYNKLMYMSSYSLIMEYPAERIINWYANHTKMNGYHSGMRTKDFPGWMEFPSNRSGGISHIRSLIWRQGNEKSVVLSIEYKAETIRKGLIKKAGPALNPPDNDHLNITVSIIYKAGIWERISLIWQ